MKKFTIGLMAAALSFSALFSNAAELREGHPEFHVVQPGDTLWDISQSFLQSPWLWPEIWHVNEQVDNPHLIFPGDILSLVYIDGQPRITKSNRLPNGTIKLTPRARELTADQAITTIPLDAILPFLTSARVLDEDELNKAPYLVGSDSERLLAAQDHKVYIRGIQDEVVNNYSFFRIGDNYMDPISGEYLGTEAVHLGEGLKLKSGDPAILKVKKSIEELRLGDRVWPTNDDQIRPVYFPHAPAGFDGGQIISVYGGVEQIGQFDIVVINRGERENMEVGHVLDIYQRGQTIVDKIATERRLDDEDVSTWDKIKESVTNEKQKVTLPDERAGQLMVFRTFDKVSLALVLKATRVIHTLDKVKTPL
ncbi:MAG: LysM peptidoglycan-binding domain-containing protein [Kangiellaceae bacterium]|nr:LysM peptidoglycan-binding domain-containing protein [Kangiellaceae bacterium]